MPLELSIFFLQIWQTQRMSAKVSSKMKLTDEEVLEIFAQRSQVNDYESNASTSKEIANKYSVSERTVRDIWSRRTRRRLTEQAWTLEERLCQKESKKGRPMGAKDSAPRQRHATQRDTPSNSSEPAIVESPPTFKPSSTGGAQATVHIPKPNAFRPNVEDNGGQPPASTLPATNPLLSQPMSFYPQGSSQILGGRLDTMIPQNLQMPFQFPFKQQAALVDHLAFQNFQLQLQAQANAAQSLPAQNQNLSTLLASLAQARAMPQ